jgi:hypothetical protein
MSFWTVGKLRNELVRRSEEPMPVRCALRGRVVVPCELAGLEKENEEVRLRGGGGSTGVSAQDIRRQQQKMMIFIFYPRTKHSLYCRMDT